jgi:hypothetical protein
VDIVIERVKADAIGTHIAHAISGRLGIEIRFRWRIDSVPRQKSAHTKTATIVGTGIFQNYNPVPGREVTCSISRSFF